MGTVFEAIHEDLDRRVALKILRDAFSLKTSGLFRKEAKTLGRLGSRFVVDVYDLVELRDGRLMIAMELLRGQPLRDVLDRAGVLPLDRVLPIARQICKGLEAAHREGVVHRDIKPENISLEVIEGRRDAVKLLDFGIAQVDESAEDRESRAGTPGYLAPEVISGVGGDLRVDVYAMGCMLFELVAARRPFENDDLSKILLAHLSEAPTAPSLHASCPASLDALILKCLAKNPESRYASAAELEAALCEVQIAEGVATDWDDLPLPDVEPEVVERLQRKMPTPRARRRQWVPWAVAGGLVIALGAGAVGYALRSSSDTTSEVQSEADSLAAGARAAAARAFFVYPPPEDPEVRTALGHVTALEAIDGAGAQYALSLATELRTEFADTLERLGDQYWDAEGGRPFALDYYAEALVFDPAREQAKRRAAMTPGELRLLRSKAETGTFTADELESVEPLIALADVDPDERSRRIASIEERSPRAKERSRQLRRVASARGQKRGKDAPTVDNTPPPAAAPVEDAIDVAEPRLDVGVELAVPEVDESTADPVLARERTKAGDAAHRRGESSKAERLYAAALSADGKHAAAHHGLGRVAFDRGNYALAARRLKKAVRLAPRKGAYRIALGDALYKSFDYDGAHAQYLRAKELGASQAAGRLAKVAKKR
jgi:tetratricopeptide (TPR) repeat protein